MYGRHVHALVQACMDPHPIHCKTAFWKYFYLLKIVLQSTKPITNRIPAFAPSRTASWRPPQNFAAVGQHSFSSFFESSFCNQNKQITNRIPGFAPGQIGFSEPSRAELIRAEPSRASRAEPSRAWLGWVEPSLRSTFPFSKLSI